MHLMKCHQFELKLNFQPQISLLKFTQKSELSIFRKENLRISLEEYVTIKFQNN